MKIRQSSSELSIKIFRVTHCGKQEIFNFVTVDFNILLISAGLAFVAVIWIELYKYVIRRHDPLIN